LPEFRQNLATKEWIILAPERGKRPHDFEKEKTERDSLPEYDKDCPFCKGNENLTLEPVYEYPEGPDWQVRVVPNKYAALKNDIGTTRSRSGMFLAAKGFGIAEVLVEHPRHDVNPALMEMNEFIQIIRAYKARNFSISENGKINLVTIFRNHGRRAGTSLVHPHSQIIATPIVPPHVRYPMQRALHHFDTIGSCVYCDMIHEEIRQKDRIIVETDNFVAFCPYAARSPFECRIYPKKHQPSFFLVDGEDIDELAWILREILAKLYYGLHDPDYNYIIRSAPVGDQNVRHLHWYMVIIPKITTPAGFEISSGIYINTTPPEDCARFLKDINTSA